MSNKRFILITLLYLLSSYSIVFSQNDDIKIEDEKSIIMRTNPYLPHAITTYGTEGFSFVYSWPGYFGYYGQSNLYYTDSYENSFFIGVGMGVEYLMSGLNLVIKTFSSSKIYLNGNIGLAGDNELSLLGSIGMSYIINNKFEWSVDLYYHPGSRDNIVFDADAPYLRGIMTNIHFKTELSESFSINYGIGLSFIQYRYLERNYPPEIETYYYYVTKYEEQEDIKSGFGRNPAWDSKFIIPFGISISYNF